MLPGTNKASVRAEVRQFIFSQCDPDIQQYFALHSFTLEPLLIQLLRELRRFAPATEKDPHGNAP